MLPTPFRRRVLLLATSALLPVGTALAQPVSTVAPNAAPAGGRTVAGQASIAQDASRTTVTQGSDRAVVEWNRFDVGRNHTVQFRQPGAGSWTLNRVTAPDPSVIAGRVQANGGVAIVNQSGVVFAQGAQVNVGSLIASAANITNENFMAGRMTFDGAARPGARVENHGEITVADRGLAVLAGPRVANNGTIRARLGRVALQGAEGYALDMAGDGLLSIEVTQAVRGGGGALVTNTGVIEAQGGSVLLSAAAASGLVEDVVRQSGRVSADADAATGRTGQVALRGEGGGVRLEGTTTAAGSAPGTRGGTVTATGTQVTVAAGGRVDVSGATGGGEARLGGASTRRVEVAGEVSARGTGREARGGRVTAQAREAVAVRRGARLDASGPGGGGTVLAGTTGIGRAQEMASSTTVEAGATIAADATGRGSGGTVVVNSAETTVMRGDLSARGGPQGGDGGFVEVSGQRGMVIDGRVDVRAPAGRAGELLIDPENIIISNSATPTLPSGSVTDVLSGASPLDPTGIVAATTGNGNEWLRIETAVITGYAGGNITLTANRQIVVDTGFTRTAAGDLRLTAGLSGGNSGADILVRSGAAISVNGGLTLETARGDISIGADLRATSLTLSARGDISQTGGTFAHLSGDATALPLSAVSTNGKVSLGQAGNGTLRLDAGTADGAFTLHGRALDLAGNLRATEVALEAVTGITQSVGTIQHSSGSVTALPVTARVTGSGNLELAGAGNGAIAFGTGGTSRGAVRVATGADGLSVTGAVTATGAVSLETSGALSLQAAVSSNNDVALRGGSITSTGAATVTAGSGRRVTLHADALALGGRIVAPSGEIHIGAIGAGVPVVLGRNGSGGDPAGLYLSAAELALLGGEGAGGTTNPATRLRITATDGVTLDGAVALRGRIGTLEIEGASGGIAQVGGTLDVGRLVLRSAGGDVSVAQDGNRIDEVAAAGASSGRLAVTSGDAAAGTMAVVTDAGPNGTTSGISGYGSVQLTAPGLSLLAAVNAGTAGSVALQATRGGITQSAAGRITAGLLTASAVGSGASVQLDAGGATTAAEMNSVARLGDSEAGGAFAFASGVALELAGFVTADGDIALTSAGELTRSAGSVTASGAGRTVTLTADRIALGAAPGGIATAPTGTVILRPFGADRSISPGATGSVVESVADLARISTGTLSLRATGAGGVTIETALDLTGIADRLDLRGASVSQSAAVTATAVSGATSGDFTLDNAANAIATASDIASAGGSVTVAASGALAAANLSAGGTGLNVSAGSLATSGTLTAGSAGAPGVVRLSAGTGALGLGGAAVTANGAGGRIELAAAGDITQSSGGGLAATRLNLSALGGATPSAGLRGSGNAVAEVQSSLGGALTLHTAGALSVVGSGIDASGGEVRLRAGSVALLAPILAAGNTVSLTATGPGGITQSAGARLTAGTLTLNVPNGSALLDAGGSLLLSDLNAVGTLGDAEVRDTLRLRQAGGIALGGLVSDGAGGRTTLVDLEAGLGNITQGAGSAVRADTVVFATPAGGVSLGQAGNDVGLFRGTVAGAVELAGTPTGSAMALGPITGASTISAVAHGARLDVVGALGASGTVSLTGRGIGLGADIDAAGQGVTLDATTGGIFQSAGRLRAATLRLLAAGDAMLETGNASATTGLNEVDTLVGATVGGTLALRNQTGFSVTGDVAGPGTPAGRAGAVRLHAETGDVTLASGAILRADTVAVTALGGALTVSGNVDGATGVRLSAGTIQVDGSVANASTGGIGLAAPAGIVLSGNISAPGQRVTLRSDGALMQAGGSVTAAELVARGMAAGSAAAGISLGSATNAIGSVVEARSAGDLHLRSSGALSVDGVVRGGDDALVRIETPGQITVATGGSITAGDPAADHAGRIGLWGSAIQLDGTLQAGQRIGLVALGGDMTGTATSASVVPGARIAQAPGGTISTRELVTVALGDVELGAANRVGAFAHRAGGPGAVTLRSTEALTIGQSAAGVLDVPNGGTLPAITGIGSAAAPVAAAELTAPSLTLAQPIVAADGGTVWLRADALALGAAVSAPGTGRVVLQGLGAGTRFALGTGASSAPGLIALSAAELATLIRTGTLSVVAGSSAGIELGTMDLRGTGPADRAARILVLQGTEVTQAAAGELSVEHLAATATAGSIRIDQGGSRTANGNTLNRLGALTADAGDIMVVAGGVAEGTARRAPALDAAGNPVGGTAPLTLEGALSAGGTITLRTDGLALDGGSLTARGGLVTIGSFSPGQPVRLGGVAGAGASALQLGADLAAATRVTGGATPTLRIETGGTLTLAGDFDLRTPGAAERLQLSAGAIGSASGAVLSVPQLEATADAGDIVLGGAPHGVDSVRLILPAAAAAAFRSARDLSVLGVATAGDGRVRDVSLSGLSLSLDGAVRGGRVALTATGAGGDITQSAALDAGRLQILTLGGDATLDRLGNTVDALAAADLRDASGLSAGALALRSEGALSLDRDGTAGIFASRVAVTAASIGAPSSGGAQDVRILTLGGPLALTATTGDIRLGAGSNLRAQGGTPATLALLAANGMLVTNGTALEAGGTLQLQARQAALTGGSLAAPAIDVTAPLGIALSGVGITGGALTFAAAGGAIGLQGTTMDLGGPASFSSALGMTFDGGSIAAQGVTLKADGDVALRGAVRLAAGASELRAEAGGSLTAEDATLSGRGISLRAVGGVDIVGGALDAGLGALQAEAGGRLTVENASLSGQGMNLQAGDAVGLIRSTLDAGSGELQAEAGASLTTEGTALSGQGIRLRAVGIMGLTDGTLDAGLGVLQAEAGGSLTAERTTVSSQGIRLQAGGAMGLVGGTLDAGAGALLAEAGGGLTAEDARLSGQGIRLQAVGAVDIARGALDAGSGELRAQSGGALSLTGVPLARAGSLQLLAGNGLSAQGVLLPVSGAAVLDAGAGTLLVQDSTITAAGLTLQARGDVSLSGSTAAAGEGALLLLTPSGQVRIVRSVLSGASILLDPTDMTIEDTSISAPGAFMAEAPGGALRLERTSIDAGTVTLGATTGLTLSGGALRAGAGAVSARTEGGALVLDGTAISGRSVTLDGGSVTAGGAAITASDGSVTAQARGGALLLRDMTIDASDGITAQAAGEVGIRGGSLSAGRDLDVAGRGVGVISGTTLSADRALFRIDGQMRLGALDARIGRLFLVAAPRGITAEGTASIAPREPALRYPAIVLDTRPGALTSDLAFLVQPDLPGLPPSLQPTQLRAAPRSQMPGPLGQATDEPGGPISLSLSAPLSPVFLLIGAGEIDGTVLAARLGVHGTGGRATLNGELNGVRGIGTAEFSDVTRPVAPGALGLYRINGCVLSAVNCAVLPAVTVLPLRIGQDIAISVDRQRRRDPDTAPPDVGQRDF